MSDVIERQTHREVRGSILRTLRDIYGRESGSAPASTFKKIVGHDRRKFIDSCLQYLVDLGYIVKEVAKVDALDDDPSVFFRLTAKGMQVINGEVADASIEL